VSTANNFAIAGMVCLALGFVGILTLLADVVIGAAAPIIVAVLAAVLIGGLWFLLPLVHRDEE